ncbi:MAG: chemotaxis protein CheA [Spirochaetes bacterium]|nr:MAG: chemotaxis protein CheA [Spirochaetota bacterium]
MEDTGIRDVFLKESREILDHLESDLIVLEEGSDPEVVHRLFRYFHTLKGSSGIAGFKNVYEFTHKVESVLDKVRSGGVAVSPELIDLLLGSLDWVREAIAGDDAAPEESRRALISKTDALLGVGESAPDAAPEKADIPEPEREIEVGFRYFRVHAAFREDVFESGIDPLLIMEDLAALGKFVERKIDRSRLPLLEDMDPEKCYLAWDLVLKTKHPQQKVDDVFLFVRDDNDISVEDITALYTSGAGGRGTQEERMLGEILTEKGILTENELTDVLISQELENKKIGTLVVEKGYATDKDLQFALTEQEKIKKKVETSTVRVDTGKLDTLLNLLGEIVIGQSGINRIADELDEEKGFRLKNALYGLDRVTREFQEQIMAIRMIPVGPSFEQFRRFVRDSAHALGKDIRLEIEGAETELDKTVIEKIGDPLKHMIRNAIDHGIETPEERGQAGKEPIGRIMLRAYHQEGNVFIEVSDDGAGVNRKRLREKAESMGIIKPGDEVNDARLLSILFMPGFSTAARVGELSGRGVGMDVVKTNIESLRGSVEIETRAGEGTMFRVKLPLTLAIIEGMLVRVGGSIYIIPLLSIVESMQPRREDISTVKEKGEVVHVRGEFVTLVRLYDLFGIKSEFQNPWESLMVIVEAGISRVGIMIDELLGQQQIVIKSLENYISRSRALSGAAILGDGRVALIIDVHGLVEELSR